MSAPSEPHPEPTHAPGHHAGDAERYRAVLDEFIGMGADIARRLHRQATAEPATANEPGNETTPAAAPSIERLADAFDRVTRTVRRCILLARKLDEPPPPDPATTAAHHRTAARTEIIRAVEDTIQRTEAGSRAATLHAELLDRLDAPELEHELVRRPVADIIADIERDLGLAAVFGTRPWKRRTPDDVAVLHARAAGSKPGGTTGQPPSAIRCIKHDRSLETEPVGRSRLEPRPPPRTGSRHPPPESRRAPPHHAVGYPHPG